MEIDLENQQLKVESKILIEQMKKKDTKKIPMVINATRPPSQMTEMTLGLRPSGVLTPPLFNSSRVLLLQTTRFDDTCPYQ
jgi:hypothetical protein